MARALPGDWNGLVVVCGSVSWTGSRLGSNFLAGALARHVPVLYVDPPVSLLRSRTRLVRAGERIARLTPAALPGKDRTGVLPLTNVAFRGALRRAVRALGADVRAVLSGPVKYDPFGVVGEERRVFRASDDFAAGGALTPLSRRRVSEMEDARAARAHVVVCASPVLVDKWRTRGHEPVLVPNGCDAAFLAGAGPGLVAPASDVDLPPPVAGYLGQLSSRIDLRLLHAVAASGVSVLLVGKRRVDLAAHDLTELVDRPNVEWVGERPFEELLPYLAAMHVGLVPYAPTEFNRASFPLKTLEYMAAGLPVVSTDLPATRWLDADPVHVRIADDPDAFAASVRDAAVTARDDRLVAARQRFAAAHSWDSRAQAYLALL